MELKEIGKDLYDIDAWLDEGLGKEGSAEREKIEKKHGKNIMLRFFWRLGRMHI